MAATNAPAAPTSGNLRKHTSGNPLQRWLLQRFHRRIVALTLRCLSGSATQAPLLAEAGCGEGFVMAELARALPTARYSGWDIRREALPHAAAQAPSAGLMLADALHLPLQAASADVVLCLEVLEHLDDPWAAVAELRRVTRGSVIVSVPNQPWFALANLARAKNLTTWGDDPEHVNHWRGGSFLRLLRQHATVREVVYSFPWVIAVCDGGR